MSDQTPTPDETPAKAGSDQALPGPHPHEASDIRSQAGLVAGWQDPMAGFREEE